MFKTFKREQVTPKSFVKKLYNHVRILGNIIPMNEVNYVLLEIIFMCHFAKRNGFYDS